MEALDQEYRYISSFDKFSRIYLLFVHKARQRYGIDLPI